MGTTFISYARKDAAAAKALYDALTFAGYDAWLDTERLPPGSKWKGEISTAIKSASAFVAVLSASSLSHRGYVQHELREALGVLKTVPANQIYLIPARLEDVQPVEVELEDLTWVDLFPSADAGYAKIIAALASIHGISRLAKRRKKPATRPRRVAVDSPIRQFLLQLPKASSQQTGDRGVYIYMATATPGLKMPADVLASHSDQVIVALQHQYEDLRVRGTSFDVLVWFSGRRRRIVVPFAAVRKIRDLHTGMDVTPSAG